MNQYQATNRKLWSGRTSSHHLYLHEKIACIDIKNEKFVSQNHRAFALLGYACDEGVQRNKGRIGAFDGSDVIRRQLAKMPNHLALKTALYDVGTIQCIENDMETAQEKIADLVARLLKNNTIPILLGGGHDIAYGHYEGIRKHISSNHTIGIINFDAHFDLRSNKNGNNSGTPFYQISKDCEANGSEFRYLCLGIRKDANDKNLFQTAEKLNVSFVENTQFKTRHAPHVVRVILDFIREVDCIYTTIDLDGFSSAFAPGVSAPSPMGFTPEIVIECLQMIIDSKKLISVDIAEMNPLFDRDDQTAKLAASLIHFVIHQLDQQ
jgi:formiminoglutamase